MKIVADDKIPFLRGILEPYAEVVYLPGKDINADKIRDADALLIRTRTRCNENLLGGTRVKFIGTATIGFDHIDTEYCQKSKIVWSNAPGCNSSSVQQYVAAALFKVASDLGVSLRDKTIGIVGVGNVGSKVEKLARIIGMNVLLNDPPRARREGDRKFTDLDKLLHSSDIVTAHVPLNLTGDDRTYHLFNELTFGKMKKGAWFLNTSRGEVADNTALRVKLRNQRPGIAVIDVWENEPDIDPELCSASTIATPHIAGYSADGKANGTAMIVSSLSSFFNIPLRNWYPSDVPGPVFPGIMLDGTAKTDEDILGEAVLHTYNIADDDERLRLSRSDFEKQRGEYPVRREFTSYSVKPENCSGTSVSALREIGFRIDV